MADPCIMPRSFIHMENERNQVGFKNWIKWECYNFFHL